MLRAEGFALPELPAPPRARDRPESPGAGGTCEAPPSGGLEELDPDPHLPRLHDSHVGFLGYEAAADLPAAQDVREPGGSPRRRAQTPDSWWVRVARHVLLDHATGRAWAVGEPAWLERVGAAAARCAAGGSVHGGSPTGGSTSEGERRESRDRPAPARLSVPQPEAYEAAVRAALAEIREGESYEVCLTGEGTATLPGEPELGAALSLYLAQRRANPAPHAAFLWGGDFAVLCSSPERFLSVDDQGWCEARPIKGTAARRADPREDASAARALAADPKSRAENLMIVDLMRNDLSRVCDPATVHVPVLFATQACATVHQLVSAVRGRLAPGRTVRDLLGACFPAGSMTGAPKPRTLRIIDRLEGRARGVYSGALGWLGADGTADLAVVIRTAVLTRGPRPGTTTVRVGAGGAVVADSDPGAEYVEMLAKLRAPLPAGWRAE